MKELNLAELEQCCGVGVVISPAQVEEAVEAEINKVKEEILAKRYRFNAGLLMATVRSGFKAYFSVFRIRDPVPF